VFAEILTEVFMAEAVVGQMGQRISILASFFDIDSINWTGI